MGILGDGRDSISLLDRDLTTFVCHSGPGINRTCRELLIRLVIASGFCVGICAGVFQSCEKVEVIWHTVAVNHGMNPYSFSLIIYIFK